MCTKNKQRHHVIMLQWKNGCDKNAIRIPEDEQHVLLGAKRRETQDLSESVCMSVCTCAAFRM